MPRKVKRKRSKPRIKKKKVLTKKQRSAAAKRGWKKRKQRQRELLALIKLGKEKALAADPALEIIQITQVYQFVNKLRGAMPTDAQQAFIDQQIKDFADEHMDVDDESLIRARLFAAEQNGTFDEELRRCAAEFGMTEGEVFTLWVSP